MTWTTYIKCLKMHYCSYHRLTFMRISYFKWWNKYSCYPNAGTWGGRKPWGSPDINICSELLNQVVQLERKKIPFHVGLLNESKKYTATVFCNYLGSKNHLETGRKGRFLGSDSQYFSSVGLVGGPGTYSLINYLVSESKAGSPIINNHKATIVEMAGGGDDGRFRPR